MTKKYYAIIDIGSNTIRLVIYQQEKTGRLHEVENVKAVARLRNHLGTANLLTPEGIDILLTTLENFSDVLDIYTLSGFLCVATATIRQADNREEIKQLVKDRFDWDMQVLTGKEEAFYGYLAVVNSTSLTEGITIDIGGGSTEVTYFKDRELVDSHSFPFGTLTLRSYMQDDQSLEQNTERLQQFITEQFKSLKWVNNKQVPIIGIGGSARNLALIDQNQKSYPIAGLHQYQMKYDDLSLINHYLKSLPLSRRENVEGLSKDRADIIIPAIEVFQNLYKEVHAEGFILSQKGLRDGLTYPFIFGGKKNLLIPNVLEDSIQELTFDYDLDPKQMFHVQFLLRHLYKHLIEHQLGGLTKEDWPLLKRACYVFNLGNYIDSESSAQHTFYLLANRTIDGLMHKERVMIALIASYKNKTLFKQFIKPFKHWFTNHERKKLQRLGAILRFGYCLDATKRQAVKQFHFNHDELAIHLTFYCDKNSMSEAYQCEKQKKHLEKALDKDIILSFTDKIKE